MNPLFVLNMAAFAVNLVAVVINIPKKRYGWVIANSVAAIVSLTVALKFVN